MFVRNGGNAMSYLQLHEMCAPYENRGLTEAMVLQGLIDSNLMENAARITEDGLARGIMYDPKQYVKNKMVPIYPDDIQDIIANNLKWFLSTYATLKAPVYESPASALDLDNQTKYASTEKSQTKYNSTEENPKFPYLGISNFVVLDTETTGLQDTDEVVEIAITDMCGKTLYSQRFYPDKEVDYGAQKVNHLSKKVLEGNPKFSAAYWNTIKEIISGRKILGHNIPFDKRLIAQTLKRYGVADDTDVVFAGMYDSKTIAKKWMTAKSYSLNKLTTQIGIEREELHEAADDCRMTIEFLNRLEDIIRIKKEYDFMKC